MYKQLEVCPCCGGPMLVTALACSRCGTAVTGRFSSCEFCRLSGEQSTFLRLFVQRRGNLSEMEKALGISYPTVRNKLEEIIRVLQEAQPSASPREAVLRQVAEGSLTPEQGLELLATFSAEGASGV